MAAVPGDIPDSDRRLLSELLDSKPEAFTDLTDTQAQAFSEGALDDGNHLLIAETGNGKTFVAEAKTRKALNNNERVAYTVPSRALQKEKYETLTQWLPDDVEIANGTGYPDADVIVSTFESFFAAVLRGLVDGYDLVVFDDFHVIYGAFRGPSIEKAMSASRDADMEIFAMSATVGNPDVIARWIGGRLTISDEPRSVPINEEPVGKLPSNQKAIGNQVTDIIENNPEKGPYLVFNDTKANAESRAKTIADHVSFETETDFEGAVQDVISTELTDAHEELIELLNSGIAYHHAGLDTEIQKLIEEYTNTGDIQVITATTTLSYGFNSPVQSVIAVDLKRYNFESNRREFIGVYEYVQWIGRAGRDEDLYNEAYAFPMVRDEEARDEFQFDRSVEEKSLEPAFSHIQNEEELRWLVLELLVHGWESDIEVMDFITKTLFWQQAVEGQATLTNEHGFTGESEQITVIRDMVDGILEWLVTKGLIRTPITQPHTEGTGYTATELGDAVVEFNFKNWLSNTVDEVCNFMDWLHMQNDNLSPEPLVECLATIYDRKCNLNTSVGNETIEMYMHNLDSPVYGKEGTTAAVVCWGWCQGTTLSTMQFQFGIDELSYLPGVTRFIHRALEAIPELYGPQEMPPMPRWIEPFTSRVEYGVPGADAYLLENTDHLGRRKYNQLQNHLNQMAETGWDPGRNEPVIIRLRNLYDERNQDDQLLRDTLRSVSGIGQAISGNTLETVKEWDPDAGTPGSEIPYQLTPDVLPNGDDTQSTTQKTGLDHFE